MECSGGEECGTLSCETWEPPESLAFVPNEVGCDERSLGTGRTPSLFE